MQSPPHCSIHKDYNSGEDSLRVLVLVRVLLSFGVCPSCFGGACAIYCFYAFVVHFLVVASALLDCQLSARTDWHKFCTGLGPLAPLRGEREDVGAG